MDKSEIINLTNQILSMNSINELKSFERYSTISLEHPYPKMLLGSKYSHLDDMHSAYIKFKECIDIELNNNLQFFNTFFADSIGLSVANILIYCIDYSLIDKS